jgi:hypothetical protein
MPDLPAARPPAVGSGLPACRRASALRRARKRKLFRQRRESGLHWIPLDITPHPREFVVVANQPERPPALFGHTDGFVARETFEGSKPLSRGYKWRSQQMNVIGHDDERMQLAASEPAFSLGQRLDGHFSNLRPPQRNGAAPGTIQQSVHHDECLAGCEAVWGQDAACRETSVQPECYEHWSSSDVPVREAPVVYVHMEICGDAVLFFSGKICRRLRRAEVRRQARRPAPPSVVRR